MSEDKCRQESKRWMMQAHADLRAAKSSAAAGSHEWACFQAQQAGEKALKALWLYHDADPWGHSIVKLIQEFPDELLRDEMAALAHLIPNESSVDPICVYLCSSAFICVLP